MKQCPVCRRTFSDELSYCLTDGTRLLAYDDEATKVLPRPAPPAPTPGQRHGIKALLVIVVILGVLLLGVLMIALLWSSSHDANTVSQNQNSAPVPFVVAGSPSPSVTPPTSPSPSPSPSVAEILESALSPGTYQCEVTRALKSEDKEGTGTLKYQFTFNSDGTFLMQGYITVYGTTMNDQLGIEEKGSYSQSNRQLLLNDRLDREYDLDTNSWKSWAAPSEGSESHEQVRNVTPTTFQLYDDKEKKWYTFAKL